MLAAAVITLGLFLVSCAKLKTAAGFSRCAPYDFAPLGNNPPPEHPPDICLTKESVELGRRLFYDRRLSGNETQACADCHLQRLAFTDGKAQSRGSTGRIHPRNSMTLANIGYVKPLTWQNPFLNRLDNQALIPFFAENTATTIEEMMITGREHIVSERLTKDPEYSRLFAAVFPGEPVDITRITRALAAFQTTLVSFRSPYDTGMMTESARRGQELFDSDRTACRACHDGPLFNADRETGRPGFHNVGLYNVAGRGDFPDYSLHGSTALRRTQGLFQTSQDPNDRGKFRTPTLRNAAVTGPYMHDGSIPTLEEVVEHFNAGGRVIEAGPFAGDGRRHPSKDKRIRPLGLSPAEKRDLVAFLRALTDEAFLSDVRFSDPSARD